MYVHRLPPCNHGCPAGENIQQWLYHAESGDYETAWRELVKDNPLPAVMGRVCYHPCETACNRAQLDDPVGIHGVERFLGDEAIRQGWRLTVEAKPTGKRVLVSRRRSLRRSRRLTSSRGAGTRLRSANEGPVAGGMMRFGIPHLSPAARCSGRRDSAHPGPRGHARTGQQGREHPRCDARRRVRRGVSRPSVRTSAGMHALPAGEAAHILDAVTLLASMEGQERPLLGRRVVVYGGGNTAMDAARTAKRLGERRDRRLPSHTRADARPRLRGAGSARRA